MKKITLALFALAGSVSSLLGQATYNQVSPPNSGVTSNLRAPSGAATQAYHRMIMYIHPYEMLPMNLADINSLGFQYVSGTGSIPVTGNFTLYVQNTDDFEYAKGTNFSNAIATMTNVYTGPFTVPGGSTPATVTIPFSSPVAFTGGGFYVAFDWESTGPFAASGASVACNNQSPVQWLTTLSSTVGPIGNVLNNPSFFRPALIFDATNTATTEIEVIDIQAPGKVAKMLNDPQAITAIVVNSSIGAQNSVSVTLTATGANPFTNTKVLNMAPGAITQVTFDPYSPTVSGQSTLVASVQINDQNLANNAKAFVQDVTCDVISHYSGIAYNTSFGFGGQTGSGYFMTRHVLPTTASLSAIQVKAGSNAASSSQPMWGVLADAAGNILATSLNTVNITVNSTHTLNFSPQVLNANTPYFFGVSQPTSGYYPLALASNTVFYAPTYYVMSLTGGTAPSPITSVNGYMGIDPVLTFSNLAITASASKTMVCKGDSRTITLSANGADSYSWTVAGAGNASTVAVTPTVSGAQGPVFYYVTGTNTTTGCSTKSVAITVSVSACTGFNELQNAEEISIFPNPAVSGIATVKGLQGESTITVLNALGQVVSTKQTEEETSSIDLSKEAAGTYLVKISNKNNEVKIIKLVNQK